MMDRTTISRYPISICVACVMHAIWAIGLALEPSSINATGLFTVMIIANDPLAAAAIYGAVATLAILGVMSSRTELRVILITPQQVILWFSVVGAIHAMYLGQYADGVQRAHWFLIVDQIPVVLVSIGHTAALLLIAERRNERAAAA